MKIDTMGLKQRFKIGKHYKIERFGILFMILAVMMTSLTAGAWWQDTTREDGLFKTTIGYTSEFKSSLSGAAGDVVGIFENEKKTKMFILLKFDEESIPNISTDANTYRLLISGVDKSTMAYEKVESNPTASLYMLGSSGYMGIMLHESAGFPLQILEIIVRMDRNFVGGTSTQVDSTMDDTFRNHDQFAIHVNPGVDRETVISADFLDKETNPTVMDIYALAESDEAEKEARNKLSDDLKQMELSFIKMREYENRLINDDIEVPERPEWIQGDRIAVYFNGQELEETRGEGKYLYPDGHEKAGTLIPDEELERVLVSDYVVPGGYNFDWYNGNIHDGYLDDLRGDKSIAVFLRDNREEEYEQSLPVSSVHWYYANGVEFTYDSELDTAEIGAINTNIQTLMDTWQEYYRMKITYERQDLENLLMLERSLTDVETSFSVNTDESNLWLNTQ